MFVRIDYASAAGPTAGNLEAVFESSGLTGLIEAQLAETLSGGDPMPSALLTTDNLAPTIFEPVVYLVEEGTLLVGNVVAFDAQNDPITFSVAGGEDALLFMIDATTGELRFIASPDFNAPDTANLDNIYIVAISANDEFGSSTQSVEIRVTKANCIDCPDAPLIIGPIAAEPFQPVIQFLNTSTSSTVTDIQIVSPGGDDAFALFGEDANRFEIDAATGVVTLRTDAALSATGSFDGDAIYEIVCLVEDSLGGSDTLEIDYLFFQGG